MQWSAPTREFFRVSYQPKFICKEFLLLQWIACSQVILSKTNKTWLVINDIFNLSSLIYQSSLASCQKEYNSMQVTVFFIGRDPITWPLKQRSQLWNGPSVLLCIISSPGFSTRPSVKFADLAGPYICHCFSAANRRQRKHFCNPSQTL